MTSQSVPEFPLELSSDRPTSAAEPAIGQVTVPRAGNRPHLVTTRIDRWLSAARIFKSRSQAQDACEGGHVTVNGVSAKASRAVQIGDKISARSPRGRFVAIVLRIEEKRQGPVQARQLYEDHSPPPDDDQISGKRPRGVGRPTKADRRAIARLTRNDSTD